MVICILDNDQLEPALAARWHSYGAMTAQWLRASGWTGDIDIHATRQGTYPADMGRYAAVVLTGSRADAFGAEPWVVRLREQVGDLLAQGQRLVGICFGHQLIAHVLGAPVARAPQGWGLGRMDYDWLGPQGVADAQGRLALLASHQDQVLALPAGATLLARSPHCPVAAYALGSQVLCVQPHPEFDVDYAACLIEARRARLTPEGVAERLASLQGGHDGLAFGRFIVRFIGQGV
ncbi:MAG: amidotransferase [Betaproteobacteria bacterium]|nr:amidotransferase [Betaproteobacteria bacterium]